MSDLPAALHRPQGPPRAPGAKAVRPRAAATLLLLKTDGPQVRLLMGRRNDAQSFMPGAWVFPGGRVDRADHHAPYAADLKPQVAATLAAHIGEGLGRALALAAIRETFEEAGLLLATPAPERPGAGPWRPFLAQGALPDLDALDILGRAITPPSIAKRYDTWFLTADADRLLSQERLGDTGELEEIAWIALDEVEGLNLPGITRFMLGELRERLATPTRPRPFVRHLNGKARRETL